MSLINLFILNAFRLFKFRIQTLFRFYIHFMIQLIMTMLLQQLPCCTIQMRLEERKLAQTRRDRRKLPFNTLHCRWTQEKLTCACSNLKQGRHRQRCSEVPLHWVECNFCPPFRLQPITWAGLVRGIIGSFWAVSLDVVSRRNSLLHTKRVERHGFP